MDRGRIPPVHRVALANMVLQWTALARRRFHEEAARVKK